MRFITKKLAGIAVALFSTLSLFAQYAPEEGNNYPSASTAEVSQNGGSVDSLLIVVIVFVFLIVIGMFVGFMVMMNQKNKQRSMETNASQLQMQELRNELSRLSAENIELNNHSVIDISEVEKNKTEKLLKKGLSSISLIFIDGERAGVMEVLDIHDPKDGPQKCRIGRDSSMCQVQLPDSDHTVSANHCMISFDGEAPREEFYLRDTEASNPTQIKRTSGKVLSGAKKVILADRDVITVGRTSFAVVILRPEGFDASKS